MTERERLLSVARQLGQEGKDDAARRAFEAAMALDAPPASQPKSLGRRIAENIVGDDDPTTQNFGEKVGTFLNMAGEAMTGGLVGDEASARAAAIIPGGMGYDERLAFERQQQRLFEDTNPGAALGAQVAGGVMAPVAAATTIPAAIGIGAGMGASYGFMEGEGGLMNRAKGGGAGAVFGAAGGAASIPLGKVLGWAGRKGGSALRNLFASKRIFDGQKITQEGIETLQALGYNVDEISDDFAKNFAQRAKDLPPEQAGRAAALDEFGIPVYRHNASGTADDFATFERARRGALGPNIEGVAREAGDRQMVAARDAAENISTGLGGGSAADQFDAAVAVREGLLSRQSAARAAAGAAYDDLANAGGGVTGGRVTKIGTRLALGMRREGFTLSQTGTPNAFGAAAELDRMFAKAADGSVPFGELERGRQALNRYLRTAMRGANEADRAAVQRLISAYDGELDSLMTTALIDGDEKTIMEAAKRARGLWADYSKQFRGDGAASRFVQAMVDEDASVDDMVRWLFSSGKLGTGKMNSTIAKGLKGTLGETSDEFGMIRQAAFRQLWQKPQGTVEFGPQAMSTRINEFLNSPATRALSRELYTPQQIAMMRRYASALKAMVPPDGAVNYSGTAYENARLVRGAFQMLMASIGGTGGPLGAAAGAAGAEVVGGARNAMIGRAMLSPTGQAQGVSGAAAAVGGIQGGNVGPSVAELFGIQTGREPQPLRIDIPGPLTTE